MEKDLIESIPKLKEPIFNDWYFDCLMEIVIYYASKPYWMDLTNHFTSVRMIVNEVYMKMTFIKELKPIEELSQKEKARIWKLTEGLEKDERIKAAKAIYLMEQILKY